MRGLHADEASRGGLHGIDLHVATGGIVAVLGGRGAGKTTLARVLSGLVPPRAGTMRFDGNCLVGLTPGRALTAGLVHVPQGRHVFPNLSLRDNLLLGATRRARAQRTATLGFVLHVFPRLVPHLDHLAGTRPVQEQAMLAIGRGLMALPRLLVLDEPTLGLPPESALDLLAAIASLQGGGLSILLTAPPVLPPLTLADRAFLLERGRVIREGPAAEIAQNWPATLPAALKDA